MSATEVFAIPGTQCDQRLWQRVRPLLPAVAWRHLPIPTGESIDELAQALLDHIPLEPVALFGFSLGGYLAARMACLAPSRIARLLVCANSPQALPATEIRQREQLLRWLAGNRYQGISQRKLAQMVAPAQLAEPAVVDCIRAMDADLGQAVLTQQLRATSQREDLFAALLDSGVPVTFCYGDQDQLVNGDWMARWRQACPAAQVYTLPGVGHMAPLEAPQALADVIRDWLAS